MYAYDVGFYEGGTVCYRIVYMAFCCEINNYITSREVSYVGDVTMGQGVVFVFVLR